MYHSIQAKQQFILVQVLVEDIQNGEVFNQVPLHHDIPIQAPRKNAVPLSNKQKQTPEIEGSCHDHLLI